VLSRENNIGVAGGIMAAAENRRSMEENRRNMASAIAGDRSEKAASKYRHAALRAAAAGKF